MATRGFVSYLLAGFSIAILSVFIISDQNTSKNDHRIHHRSFANSVVLHTDEKTWPAMEFDWRIVLATVIGFLGSAFGVDGAVIVQPINHKFDHSYVTSVLKKHPSKFVGCCLANPAQDGTGLHQLEHLILEVEVQARTPPFYENETLITCDNTGEGTWWCADGVPCYLGRTKDRLRL